MTSKKVTFPYPTTNLPNGGASFNLPTLQAATAAAFGKRQATTCGRHHFLWAKSEEFPGSQFAKSMFLRIFLCKVEVPNPSFEFQSISFCIELNQQIQGPGTPLGEALDREAFRDFMIQNGISGREVRTSS